MNKKGKVKILVVSDLHTQIDNKIDDSRLIIEDYKLGEYAESLVDYVRSINNDTLDLIVCSGDIANKGCEKSFAAGWFFLRELQEKTNNPHLICVPGNHDHQSRNDITKCGFSPKHSLQFVSPAFPFRSHEMNTHFWAWNWAVCNKNEGFNVLCVNTSAYHGYGDEYKHGRLPIETTNQIVEHIQSEEFNKSALFNILVCHHHPEKMEHVDEDYDYESMEGGSYLLKKLDEADVGPWLVIHGHKHFATLRYGSSYGGAPPTILSAASVSAILYDKIENLTSNQMYILEIDLDETADKGKLVGNFYCHEWTCLSGWQPSESDNLPHFGGFGSSITPKKAVDDITAYLHQNGPFIEGEEIFYISDLVKHFTPKEYKSIITKLDNSGISLVYDKNRNISQIGFKNA